MRIKTILIVALFICCLQLQLLAGSITLVDSGKPVAVIALSNSATRVEKASAENLNKYVKLITGVSLPIKTENEIGKNSRVVSIGITKLAMKAGIDSKKLSLGEFICRIDGNKLFICGGDDNIFDPIYGKGENGIWNGTCRFVEEVLGVIWLWPGEYGLVVPENRTLTVKLNGDFTEKPQILRRHFKTRIYQKYWDLAWQEVGVDNYSKLSNSLYAWQKFQLDGGHILVSPGAHGFTLWWDKYSQTHPEWFAMQTDGSRKQHFDEWVHAKATVKLCISNPEVAKQVVKNAVEYYNSGQRAIFLAGHNDNETGFCLCEKCMAWDHPKKAEPFKFLYKSGPLEYCSLSDRYVRFWNRIGKEFSKKCPGKYIAVSAYSCTTAPPVVEKIRYKCIMLGFVGFSYFNDKVMNEERKYWSAWRRMTVGKMAMRTNVLWEGFGANYVYISELGVDYNKYFSGGKTIAIDNDCLFNYWGTNGLNYYMIYKLMWNPSMNVDKALDTYCSKGFGAAAPQVKRFFKAVETITHEIAAKNWNWREDMLNGLPTIYTPARIKKLQVILAKAMKLAKGDDKKRVDFLIEGLEYTRILVDVLRAKFKSGIKSEDFKKACQARANYFKNQKYPFSAPYPADKFWRSRVGLASPK